MKRIRFEIRIKEEEKKTVSKAAKYLNVSMSKFVKDLVLSAASRVIKDAEDVEKNIKSKEENQ